jgi:nicotinamidase-related amidase
VEVVDELTPLDAEPVVHNWPFDIFRCTDVEQRLRERGVETVILVGVATGMAINIAAYQLADRFFNLIVPSDCVTDGNRQLHEAIMSGIMPVIGLVTTSADVVAHL